jgi:hypothetical protein
MAVHPPCLINNSHVLLRVLSCRRWPAGRRNHALGFLAVAAWIAWRFGPTLARVSGWGSLWVAWACGSQGGYWYCAAFLIFGAVADLALPSRARAGLAEGLSAAVLCETDMEFIRRHLADCATCVGVVGGPRGPPTTPADWYECQTGLGHKAGRELLSKSPHSMSLSHRNQAQIATHPLLRDA